MVLSQAFTAPYNLNIFFYVTASAPQQEPIFIGEYQHIYT